MTHSPGHVFVVHGDLSKLACDAWMLPTDDKLTIEKSWGVSHLLKPVQKPDNWDNDGLRILRVADLQEWPQEYSSPYIVNVGGIKLPICAYCEATGATTYCHNDDTKLCLSCDLKLHDNKISAQHKREPTKDIEWYVEGARLFFDTVWKELATKQPRYGRERHLIALPLIGTGKGGAQVSAGGMVVALLRELLQVTQRIPCDIALVAIKKSMFAAIQVQRSRIALEHDLWSELTPRLKVEAERLASLAREGGLVLFLGSGVSSSAGLPNWGDLLAELAKKGGMTDEEVAVVTQMNYLDAARVIEIQLGGSRALSDAVAARVSVHSYSLVCGLLAGIPVREVITTNYNRMYEIACGAIGLDLAVLPYAPASSCDRWILKMHGCVSHPDDIVLTREHYMRYSTNRSALSGIVQSLLITRHMLFVGFSLKDDNFHRIIDEVRRSVRKTETAANGPQLEIQAKNPEVEESSNAKKRSLENSAPAPVKFGTQLSLSENSITKMLWTQDVDVIAMDEKDALSRKEQARSLEIFLDYMLYLSTTTTRFLMNPQYDVLLEPGQRSLRDSLSKFLGNLSQLAMDAPEFDLVKKLLLEMGWKEANNGSLDKSSTPVDISQSPTKFKWKPQGSGS